LEINILEPKFNWQQGQEIFKNFICIFTFKGFTKGTIYKFFKHLYLLFSFHLHLKIETALFVFAQGHRTPNTEHRILVAGPSTLAAEGANLFVLISFLLPPTKQ